MSLLSKLEAKEPLVILVTGAAGQIAYSLLFLLARGLAFGADQPVSLHLLEVPAALPRLAATVLELDDCACPLLRRVLVTSDLAAACAGVDIALLVGAKPRGPGEERADLLKANAAIFSAAGAALAAGAARHCRVLVVGNPANTNALLAARAAAPALPPEHFTALTRLDQNRAAAELARVAGGSPADVEGVYIWGNHS